MADGNPIFQRQASADVSLPTLQETASNSSEFRQAFGEELQSVLDVSTWRPGGDLTDEYQRVEREVRDAIVAEDEIQHRTREHLFAKLSDPRTAVPQGGVYAANLKLLPLIHRGLLFNGGVECCDGTIHTHDTLPLTIHQIGVSLVSYRGDQGTWQHRLFRRDLRQRGGDPVDEIMQALERRAQRSALNHESGADSLGELARKAVMAYAERAILVRRSSAVWRMGHGNPITYELLTGAGMMDFMVTATQTLRALIQQHKKFVFVASEPRDRILLTIGQALGPMQYAIVSTLDEQLRTWLHQLRFKAGVTEKLDWDGESISPSAWIPRFLDRVATQVVVGVFRASPTAPAQVFYAHPDHAHVAAHIVLADSMLQDHRGFPLLIDLADHVCSSVFGSRLQYLTETAYAAAGAPWRYFSERTTRAR